MSKLFSAFSLIDETCTSMNLSKSVSEDTNLFSESLDFLIKQDRILTFEKAKLYSSISESGDNMILIDEAFSDYIKTIRGYIDKVIEFFKKLFAKFWQKINSVLLRDKYISKHKSELSKFRPEMEFEINGYGFNFSESVPNPFAINDIKDIIEKISKAPSNAEDLGKEYAYIIKSYNKIKDDNKYMDKVRKDILGVKYNISEDKWQEELNGAFISSKEKGIIKVNKACVDAALKFFEDSAKLQEQTKKQCDDTTTAYSDISKSLANIQKVKDSIITNIKVSDFVDPDTKQTVHSDKYIETVDLFINILAIRIDAISKAHIMAYSAKLEAIKQCFIQDKTILYGAFKAVIDNPESSDPKFSMHVIPGGKGELGSVMISFENEAAYYKYLTEMAIGKEKIIGLAKTTAAIKEDASFEQLYSIREDAVETLKNTWQRFDAFIKRLFAKFMDYFNRVIRTNVGWLEKYKDTILKVKPDSTQIDGVKDYQAGIQNMMRLAIPTFDQVKDKVPNDITNNGDFVRTMISTYNESNDTDLSKFCIEYFEGGPETKTIDMMNMNMTDMYNYCHDANKMNDIVSKDIKNIEAAYNAILPQLKELQNKQAANKQNAATQKQPPAQQQPAAGQPQLQTNTPATSGTPKKESFLYESLTKKERDAIPSNQFGLEKERKYPLDTKEHIESAIRLFGHCPENRKEHLAKRINSFAKRSGITIEKDTEVYKYAHGIKEMMIDKYLNQFFNEADQPQQNNQQAPKGLTINTNANNAVANNIKSTTDNKEQQGAINIKNDETENNIEDLIKKLNVYKDTTTIILKAKMTAIHYIYGEYMKLIKYHVHNKVGENNNITNNQNGETNNSTNLIFDENEGNKLRGLVKAVTDAQTAKNTDGETKAKEAVLNFVKEKYPNYNGSVDTIINAVK